MSAAAKEMANHPNHKVTDFKIPLYKFTIFISSFYFSDLIAILEFKSHAHVKKFASISVLEQAESEPERRLIPLFECGDIS